MCLFYALTLIVITCLSCCMFLLPWLQQCVIRFFRFTDSSYYTPRLVPSYGAIFAFVFMVGTSPLLILRLLLLHKRNFLVALVLCLRFELLATFRLECCLSLGLLFLWSSGCGPFMLLFSLFSWSLPSASVELKRRFADSGNSLWFLTYIFSGLVSFMYISRGTGKSSLASLPFWLDTTRLAFQRPSWIPLDHSQP